MIAILLLLISCTAELKVEDTTSKVENPITWSTCSQNLDDHPCNFTLLDQNGSNWSLYDHYGSIIVLDFSTEWCGYCNVSGSTIQALQNEYTNLDVIFVTLLIEDNYGNPATKELCASWADRHSITAPVLAGSRELTRKYIMNTSYTVISTSNIDDYKRPSSSSSALLTTTDHEQALIVAANAWLEEYNDTFCYQGENEYEHFSGVLDMLQERPAPGKIVDYFNENKWTIWEPEFIDSPNFQLQRK